MGSQYQDIADRLIKSVRLSTIPIALKFYQNREDALKVPKVRTTSKTMSPCQIIGQALQFNWTAVIFPEVIHIDYCRTVNGMHDADEKFMSGEMITGVWHETKEASQKHMQAFTKTSKLYDAMIASPLSAGRLDEPDVCLLYATPEQMFMLLAGYTYKNYEKLEFSFVGESTCSDSWIKTLTTGKPGLSLPCYAERKFGGVRHDLLLLSVTPAQLEVLADGVDSLARNGLRFPIAPYSLTQDIKAGIPEEYFKY